MKRRLVDSAKCTSSVNDLAEFSFKKTKIESRSNNAVDKTTYADGIANIKTEINEVENDDASAIVKKCIGLETKYRDKLRSICNNCFEGKISPCLHLPLVKLKLLIVGHNPSIHAFNSGFFYSNPTNLMWKLLTGFSHDKDFQFKGILPSSVKINEQNKMPHLYKVGFMDIGSDAGNDAVSYDHNKMKEWRKSFYKRLTEHISQGDDLQPNIIAFSGKRQFQHMFDPPLKSIEVGLTQLLPPLWPLDKKTKIFVLNSSSGRAVLKKEDRIKGYRDLSLLFHSLP